MLAPPRRLAHVAPWIAALSLLFAILADAAHAGGGARTIEIPFTTHDDYEMFGKLTLPESGGPHAVVIYVQTAEGMTVDMKRPDGRGGTFNYFDLYAKKLPEMNVAFFRYEGRGIRLGDAPPRYEQIERDVYDTSTLENKVLDILSAVQVVREQADIDTSRIFLMGASEGTLLAAQAAAKEPKQIAGLILYGVMTSNMRDTFRYILTEGAHISYCGRFDANHDGVISKAEYEADPGKYRTNLFKGLGFEVFDVDGDGSWTVADTAARAKPMLDAIDQENYQILDAWARTSAAVSTPRDWFKNHFAQQPIWTSLSQLDVPVGLFQGALDTSVPIAGVRNLEQQAKKAGKTKMEFHYFENLEHTLGIGSYFVTGKLPDGHKAIFEFIERQTRKP